MPLTINTAAGPAVLVRLNQVLDQLAGQAPQWGCDIRSGGRESSIDLEKVQQFVKKVLDRGINRGFLTGMLIRGIGHNAGSRLDIADEASVRALELFVDALSGGQLIPPTGEALGTGGATLFPGPLTYDFWDTMTLGGLPHPPPEEISPEIAFLTTDEVEALIVRGVKGDPIAARVIPLLLFPLVVDESKVPPYRELPDLLIKRLFAHLDAGPKETVAPILVEMLVRGRTLERLSPVQAKQASTLAREGCQPLIGVLTLLAYHPDPHARGAAIEAIRHLRTSGVTVPWTGSFSEVDPYNPDAVPDLVPFLMEDGRAGDPRALNRIGYLASPGSGRGKDAAWMKGVTSPFLQLLFDLVSSSSRNANPFLMSLLVEADDDIIRRTVRDFLVQEARKENGVALEILREAVKESPHLWVHGQEDPRADQDPIIRALLEEQGEEIPPAPDPPDLGQFVTTGAEIVGRLAAITGGAETDQLRDTVGRALQGDWESCSAIGSLLTYSPAMVPAWMIEFLPFLEGYDREAPYGWMIAHLGMVGMATVRRKVVELILKEARNEKWENLSMAGNPYCLVDGECTLRGHQALVTLLAREILSSQST